MSGADLMSVAGTAEAASSLDVRHELLRVHGNGNTEVLRIASDGRIFWRGREVETDDDFRAAMIDLAATMQRICIGGAS